MADCEKGILEAADVVVSVPAANELVLFTPPAGPSVLRTWATIIAGLVPNDVELRPVAVGPSHVDQIVVGDPVVQITSMIGRRVRILRNKANLSVLDGDYTWNQGTGTATFTVAPANVDELFKFESY